MAAMNTIVCFILIELWLSFSALPPASAVGHNAQIDGDVTGTVSFGGLRGRTAAASTAPASTTAAAELKALARDTLLAAVAEGSDAAAYAIGQLEKVAKNPAAHGCFFYCARHYSDAVDVLSASVEALPSGDYGGARTRVSAAVADGRRCREACKGVAGKKAEELRRRNYKFLGLCRSALALVKRLAAV